ncbi:MAG: peptidase E [Candidatus Moraniibacteriota bacterium]
MENTKTIVAIGGGELKDLETILIDRAIVALSGKKRARALFIPTASSDALEYWESFQKVYGERLGCKTDALFLIREKPSDKEIKAKILSSDIIYVGGGNTLKMLCLWRKQGVDIWLYEAYENGIILAGLSAGAICWFRFGLSDSRRFTRKNFRFMKVRGLGLLPFIVSPHHIREKEKREKGIKDLMKHTSGVALALDDNSAIVFRGESYEILRSQKGSKIHKVFSRHGKVENVPVKAKGRISDLHKK